jgi:tetratricopeptide (TPR) repeat protein
MVRRSGPVWLCLLCLGCHPFLPLVLAPDASSGSQLWLQGQEALDQGQPEEALAFYEKSLAADPGLVRNHLSMAAAYLEKGDEARACLHLGQYLAAHPDHTVVRGHLAELLVHQHRFAEARPQFERFLADVQEDEELADRHRLHCHRRLMEIGEAEADEYGEHLHRGIGLYLLACQRAALPHPDGALPAEGLLCKAVQELSVARLRRPKEARPCWYLHEAWSRLAQYQPARRWLHAAYAAAPFSYLTPTERHDLHLAYEHQALDRPLK